VSELAPLSVANGFRNLARISQIDPDGEVSEALSIRQQSIGGSDIAEYWLDAIRWCLGKPIFGWLALYWCMGAGDVPIVRFSRVDVPADGAISDETKLVQELPRMGKGC
jgi:hypothetical protein